MQNLALPQRRSRAITEAGGLCSLPEAKYKVFHVIKHKI